MIGEDEDPGGHQLITRMREGPENRDAEPLYQGAILAALFHSGAKRWVAFCLLVCGIVGGNPMGLGSGRL